MKVLKIIEKITDYVIVSGIINGVFRVAENVKEKQEKSVYYAFFDGYLSGYYELPAEIIKSAKDCFKD